MDLPPTVYAIEDDPLILKFIETVVRQQQIPIQSFTTGEDFLAKVPGDGVGCVIIDLNLPGISGVAIQQRLRQRNSALSVIVATGGADVRIAVQIMQNGAITLLEKPFTPAALMDAIRTGIERSRDVFTRQTHLAEVRRRLTELTEEEREVLEQLIAGLPNKSIAAKLVVSPRTVDRYRQSVLRKMQVGTIPELASLMAPLQGEGSAPRK
jgi:two-component system response regulator FixJ